MFRMKSFVPKLYLKLEGVKFSKGLSLYGWPVIKKFKGSTVEIGENVTVKSEFLSNLAGMYQRTVIVARDGGKVVIGDNVGMSGATIYARGSITIGDNTLIGVNSKIMDNDFHPLDAEARNRNEFDKLVVKPVSIGKNVFIGCNSIILKGTTLDDGCVVGAGSVVSGNFPAGSVIAGNPARVIRSLNE